jgi:hypothetical protein
MANISGFPSKINIEVLEIIPKDVLKYQNLILKKFDNSCDCFDLDLRDWDLYYSLDKMQNNFHNFNPEYDHFDDFGWPGIENYYLGRLSAYSSN